MKLAKKHLYISAALLFSLFTGIILCIGRDSSDTIDVFSESQKTCVLIIDAGHGGADGGAVAADGTKESLINLQIALRMEELASFCGLRSFMTRSDEELPYPETADTIAKKKLWDQHRRLDIINSAENAVFLSIHQNKYPDSRPHGPQVLYGKTSGSQHLGELCHELLNENLCPENRRLAAPAPDEIFLMKNADCPAILVECGFISNHQELQLLIDNSYQKKMAAIMMAAYLNYISP